MKKRVGVIAFLQESNTFIARPTVLSHFHQDLLLCGESVRERLANTHHEVGGFFAELERCEIQAVPLFAARAMPFGVMSSETFQILVESLATELKRSLPLDGVLVAPHGATVSQHVRDVDGYWLSQVRQIVGSDCPIIGTLDLHANLSEAMVAATDALVAYRTNPHVDQHDRGVEAARLMIDTLRGKIRPVQAVAFPPLVINIECQETAISPCKELYDVAARLRNESGVLSSSICLGFPYADVAEMGASMLVVAHEDREFASRKVNGLAQAAWEMRAKFQPKLTTVDEAMHLIERLAIAGRLDRPACLLDMGDNVGGGSPGDGTWLVHALQTHRIGDSFVCLFDPEAVYIADQMAIGNQKEFAVGAKTDAAHGRPLQSRFTIIAKSDGRFTESQPRHGGFREFDQGRTVVVRSDAGVTIMLTSQRVAPWSLAQIRHCGLDPHAFKILVAKGVHAPIAAYREVCQHFIRVNTPGVTSADLSLFEYHNRRQPMFPFETETTWSARQAETLV